MTDRGLERTSRRGPAKNDLEYVQVAADGQAMAGQVETGKTAGPPKKKREPNPATKAIPDDPAETIDLDLKPKQSTPRRNS